MAEFGGIGGIFGGRPFDADDLFELAVEHCLGDQLRADSHLCCKLWGALANQDWQHVNGNTASYSFRAAGDLIAAIVGKGDYLDWYCSYSYPVVEPEIRDAMANENWFPIINNYPTTYYVS